MVWHPPLTNIHTLPLSFQSPFCSSILIQDPTSTMMIFGKGIKDDDLFRRHERNPKASERVPVFMEPYKCFPQQQQLHDCHCPHPNIEPNE